MMATGSGYWRRTFGTISLANEIQLLIQRVTTARQCVLFDDSFDGGDGDGITFYEFVSTDRFVF
jgi:hypothetical protein